jgi:hypothetical protein
LLSLDNIIVKNSSYKKNGAQYVFTFYVAGNISPDLNNVLQEILTYYYGSGNFVLNIVNV